jgi:hypothetical protein
MELQESDDSDNDDDNETSNQSGTDNMKKLFSFKQTMKQVEWPNLPVAVEAEKRYFDVAVVGKIALDLFSSFLYVMFRWNNCRTRRLCNVKSRCTKQAAHHW